MVTMASSGCARARVANATLLSPLYPTACTNFAIYLMSVSSKRRQPLTRNSETCTLSAPHLQTVQTTLRLAAAAEKFGAAQHYCLALAIASSRAKVSLVNPSMLDLSTSVPHKSCLRAARNAFSSNLAGVARTSDTFPLIMPGRESLGGSVANSSSNPGAATMKGGGGEKEARGVGLPSLKKPPVSPAQKKRTIQGAIA